MIPFLAPLLLRFPLLGKIPWRLVGTAVAVIAVVWFAWAKIDAYGDRRYKAGKAEIQALWKADTEKRDAADAKIVADNIALKAANNARNEEIERDYQSKLAAIESSRDQYVGLFNRARSEVRAVAAREATSVAIAVSASQADRTARIERSLERVERAAERIVPESTATADQLDALIAEIKPQM